MRYNYLLEVQLCFGNEIYKSLAIKYHLEWGISWGTHTSLWGTHLLDQSYANPDVMWANDCVISHDCAISHDNYAISYSLFLVKKIDV